VEKTITILERKYPTAQGIFIFDHAPKKPEDALNVERMNVKNGGKQPFMKDTLWDRHTQRMVTPSGLQKGMRRVLEERGIDTRGNKLREILGSMRSIGSTR
jgi:hypothetical protein